MNDSPAANGAIFIGVNHCNPVLRLNRTDSARGPHFTRVPHNGAVSRVAVRRTLSTFHLPQAVNRRSNSTIIVNIKQCKPCVCGGNGCASLPHSASPLAIALSRTITILTTTIRRRGRGRLHSFSRSDRVRVLGKHCKPCVTCGNGGCHLPGGCRATVTAIDCSSYLTVISTTSRQKTTAPQQEGQ